MLPVAWHQEHGRGFQGLHKGLQQRQGVSAVYGIAGEHHHIGIQTPYFLGQSQCCECAGQQHGEAEGEVAGQGGWRWWDQCPSVRTVRRSARQRCLHAFDLHPKS